MTNKSPNKVVKNAPRPKTNDTTYQVIRHFEPKSYRARDCSETSIKEYIEKEEELNPKVVRKPKPPKASSPSRVVREPRVLKSAQKRNNSFKSVSSSSFSFGERKLNSSRPKSFHGKETILSDLPQVILKPTYDNDRFKSSTDSSLLRKDLNVKQLRDEISKSRKVSRLKVDDSAVKNLQEEIRHSREKDIVFRKSLVTELKTEIAQYQKYDNFYVYSLYGDDPERCKVNSPKLEKCCKKKSESCESFKGSSSSSEDLQKSALTDTDSLDDELIKLKISQAYMLINRVKSALDKIRTSKQPAIDNSDGDSQIITAESDLEGDLPIERPKTRRCEEEVDEFLLIDKYRTVAGKEQVENDSSFETLRNKLNTISESTESTSRKMTEEVVVNVSVGCNTDSRQMESRGVQVKPEIADFEVQETPLKVTKATQTDDCTSILNQQEFLISSITPTPNELKAENVHNLSINPVEHKLKKLSIQTLPSVTIHGGNTVKRTLNMSIDPDGTSCNYLKNCPNVVFVEMEYGKANQIKHDSFSFDELQFQVPKLKVKYNYHSDTAVPPDKKQVWIPQDGSDQSNSEDPFFMENSRTLFYKSYHLYDNPNRHDPGSLGNKSLDKLSAIDMDVYKTYINPEGLKRSSIMTRSNPNNLGLDAKQVQCTRSVVLKDIDLSKNPEQDRDVLRKFSSYGLFEMDDSVMAPSEITLTISCSSSQVSRKESTAVNWNENRAAKDAELNRLTSQEKRVMRRLKEKFETIDLKSSRPVLTVFNPSRTINEFISGLTDIRGVTKPEDSLVGDKGSKKPNDNSDTTVNYCLVNVKRPNHLEVGKNGRYKDEENLFCPREVPTKDNNPTKDKYIASGHITSTTSDIVTSTEKSIECRDTSSVKNLKKKPHARFNQYVPQRDLESHPKLKIERRRNYFNNWVTYYVQTKEFTDSTTSTQ